jgi:hypothetical protein
VARCWAFETGVAVGADMEEALPPNEYWEAYASAGHVLTVKPRDMVDQNSKEYLAQLQVQVRPGVDMGGTCRFLFFTSHSKFVVKAGAVLSKLPLAF